MQENEEEPEIRISREYWEAEFEIDEKVPAPTTPTPAPKKPQRFRKRKQTATLPPAESDEWEPAPPLTRTDWSLCSIAKVEWFIFKNRLAIWTAPIWFT